GGGGGRGRGGGPGPGPRAGGRGAPPPPGGAAPPRPGPGPVRAALPAAGLLGAHTYAVTAVSRHEARGGSTAAPLAALAATAALATTVLRERHAPRGTGTTAPETAHAARPSTGRRHRPSRPLAPAAPRLLATALTGSYLGTAGHPLLHAALNPSPPLTRRAVGGGIRAMIPLQAALAARAGAAGTGLAVMGLVPLARSLARKVSPT
ncbi:prenyltransferase, partial [Streptomyces sp. NPDC056061]